MTAIETMKAELTKKQQEADKCVSPSGHILSEHRYDFMIAVREAKEIREAIETFERITG